MKAYNAIDNLSEQDIQNQQKMLLAEAIEYACEYSPYYRKKIDCSKLNPNNASSISSLPFTTKEDLQNGNWDFLAVKKEDISEIVSTTGTTGDPVFIAMTNNDLSRLAVNEARIFSSAGAGRGDLFHIAVTCDNLFIAGMAYYRGITQLGASAFRVGPQNLLRHIDLLQKMRPHGMVAVPSFMVHLARRLAENGIDPSDLGIKQIMLIGDSIRDETLSANTLGNMIENAYRVKCFSTYGITEAQLSFFECQSHQGLHCHPDLVYVEIVDDNGNVLPDGEAGELVLTLLQVEGMPLLRYKTGDVTFKISEPCNCGKNSVRIGPILGRKQHKLKVKGVTLYPKSIENALLGCRDVVNYQIEAHIGDDETDDILLRVGLSEACEISINNIQELIRSKARVTPRIVASTPEEIEKRLFEGGSRKPMTFKDMRRNFYEQGD